MREHSNFGLVNLRLMFSDDPEMCETYYRGLARTYRSKDDSRESYLTALALARLFGAIADADHSDRQRLAEETEIVAYKNPLSVVCTLDGKTVAESTIWDLYSPVCSN